LWEINHFGSEFNWQAILLPVEVLYPLRHKINCRELAASEAIAHATAARRQACVNELVTEIHDRMPLILASGDYARWLSDEPNPRGLMRLFPAEPMRMWPISTRVKKPENDDPSIVEPIELSAA
jgi:hypothetical protein